MAPPFGDAGEPQSLIFATRSTQFACIKTSHFAKIDARRDPAGLIPYRTVMRDCRSEGAEQPAPRIRDTSISFGLVVRPLLLFVRIQARRLAVFPH